MYKFAIILILVTTTQTYAETNDVSQLSSYEKQMHRLGWCTAAWWNSGEHDTYEIGDIIMLLGRNGFEDNDVNRIRHKAIDDLKAELIIGSRVLTQKDFDNCFKDLKDMLSNHYIPNFSYMER